VAKCSPGKERENREKENTRKNRILHVGKDERRKRKRKKVCDR